RRRSRALVAAAQGRRRGPRRLARRRSTGAPEVPIGVQQSRGTASPADTWPGRPKTERSQGAPAVTQATGRSAGRDEVSLTAVEAMGGALPLGVVAFDETGVLT